MAAEAKAKSGEFAKLAEKYTDDPSGKTKGGDLGWFGAGKMVREFEQAVSNAPNRLIPKLVRTQFGFHIIKKTGQR